MEYPYFKGLEADRYSFYRVPKALVKADLFQKMSGDAKLLYAVLLDRMSLSIKNGWQDKHGNAYIICTIQYRANGQWVLYSEHHGKGYTSSLTFRLQRSDGSEVEKMHTAWTQKGRKFLYHTLKRRGVLPLAEQGG